MASIFNTLSLGVLALFNSASVFLGREKTNAESQLGDGPGYNPQFWTDSLTTQKNNNCYNYAINRTTNTFAQPGSFYEPFGLLEPYDCKSITDNARLDGLQPLPSAAAPCDGHKVFMGAYAEDFHWWRQDGPNFWTHKPGSEAPMEVDASGQKIRDPLKANLGPYKACGFFCVEDEKVVIS